MELIPWFIGAFLVCWAIAFVNGYDGAKAGNHGVSTGEVAGCTFVIAFVGLVAALVFAALVLL